MNTYAARIQEIRDLYTNNTDVDLDEFEQITPGASKSCFSANLTNPQYHADRHFVSRSGLAEVLKSPAHFKTYLERKNETTTKPNIGSAVHCKLLEPTVFEDQYVVWTGGRRDGRKWDTFQAANKGKTILNDKELAQVTGASRAVMEYPHWPIGHVIKTGLKEFSVFWIDEETGVCCKVRFDVLYPKMVFDLKTTDDAREKSVQFQIQNMDYDLQVAFYEEACLQFTGKRLPFVFGFIEINEPHGFIPYPVDETVRISGRNKMREALRRYQEIVRTGEFPGYALDTSNHIHFSARQIFTTA